MPEKRNILDVLSEDYNIDIENLSDHNKAIEAVGNCMSRYGMIAVNKLIIAVKYEFIAKLRFNKLFTRPEVTKFKIAGYTKTELEQVANGEDVGRVVGDEFYVENDNLLYIRTIDSEGKETKIKIEDNFIIIFNQFDEWEIFKNQAAANKYYDVNM